jgi:hypothetical protein
MSIEHPAQHDPIIERFDYSGGLLALFVALAGHHEHVTRPCERDGGVDRPRAVRLDEHAGTRGHSLLHRGEDR